MRSSRRSRDARDGQLEQLDEDVDLSRCSSDAASATAAPASVARGGRGTGLPTGRMPDRGVDRPPVPRRGAARPPLRQPAAPGDHRTARGRSTSAPPAGASTAAPTPAAGRSRPPAGRSAAHPWRVTRQVQRADPGAARRADHRHLRLDGRLRVRARPDRLDPHRRPAPDRRALRDRAVRQRRRRCSPTAPSRCALVPGIRTGGGTAFAGDAIELVSRPARDDQPAPPPVRLRALRRRVGGHRAGVERIRWLAEHGVPTIHLAIGIAPLSVECERITVITDPAAGARPHRRRHRRRARAPRRADPRSHHPLSRKDHACPIPSPPFNPALLPSPALFDVTTVAGDDRRRPDRARRARAARARRQPAPRDLPRGHRPPRRDADAHRPARALHRPPPRPAPARGSCSTTASAGCSPPRQATGSPAATGFEGLAAGAQPDRAAARPRPRRGRDPPHPGPGQPARGAHARRPAGAVARLLAGPRRPAAKPTGSPPSAPTSASRPQARAQPPPPAHAARADPRPRRRAPDRRAALGHDGQPARRHARDRARSSPRRSPSGSPAATCTTRRCATSARSCTAPSSRTSTPTPCGSTTAPCSTPPSRSTHARAAPRPTTAGGSSPRILGCDADELDAELDALAARAKASALKIRITAEMRDRARTGRYAFVHDRGPDFAAGIWVVDPAFMLDLVHEHARRTTTRARARGGVLRRRPPRRRRAARRRRRRRAAPSSRRAPATPRRPARNLGLGHDIRAGLIDPTRRPAPRAAGRSSASCSPATTAS